jgi:hypothetical protein
MPVEKKTRLHTGNVGVKGVETTMYSVFAIMNAARRVVSHEQINLGKGRQIYLMLIVKEMSDWLVFPAALESTER